MIVKAKPYEGSQLQRQGLAAVVVGVSKTAGLALLSPGAGARPCTTSLGGGGGGVPGNWASFAWPTLVLGHSGRGSERSEKQTQGKNRQEKPVCLGCCMGGHPATGMTESLMGGWFRWLQSQWAAAAAVFGAGMESQGCAAGMGLLQGGCNGKNSRQE